MKRKDLKFCAAMAFFFAALLLAISAHASPGDIHTLAGTGIQEAPVKASSVSSSDAWVTATFTKPARAPVGQEL